MEALSAVKPIKRLNDFIFIMKQQFLDKRYPVDRQLLQDSWSDARLFAAYWMPLIGFCVSLTGLIVLFGWIAGIETLTRITSGYASMKPNTALAFLLVGIALGLSSKLFPIKTFRLFQLGLCTAVFLLSAWDLSLSFSDSTEQFDFSIIDVAALGENSSRMSFMTAVSFLLIAASVALLLGNHQRMSAIAGGLGIGVFLIASFVITAYAIDAQALYALESFESMALHTSILFFLLSVGTLGVVFAANFNVVPNLDSVLLRNGLFVWLFLLLFEYISAHIIVDTSEDLPAHFLALLDVRTLVTVIASAVLIFAAVALLTIKNQEQQNLQERLANSRERLDSIMNSTAEGIYGIDINGNCNFVNQSCLELLGFSSRDELLGKNMHSLVHHTHADGSDFHLKDCPIYQSLSSSDRIHVDDEVFWRKDGTSVPVEYWSYPLVRDGKITGSVVTFVNISERMKAEETRQLLMREVNHRANNLLSVVQTIARQTAKQKNAEDFSDVLLKRLQSLAGSQDLIIKGNWRAVYLEPLLKKQFALIGMNKFDRCEFSGPKIQLSPHATQGIGMAFHELATNSIKYGALSNDKGKVHVTWRITNGQDEDALEIEWREKNGPAVKKPERQGFGSTVIDRLVSSAVDGDVELDYKKSGLIWHLVCPLKSATVQN